MRTILTISVTASAHVQYLATSRDQKIDDRFVELGRVLEHGKMANTVLYHQLRAWDLTRKPFRMLKLDDFVVIAGGNDRGYLQ